MSRRQYGACLEEQVEGILVAEGPPEARRWLVKWSGYDEVTWEARSRWPPSPAVSGHAPP